MTGLINESRPGLAGPGAAKIEQQQYLADGAIVRVFAGFFNRVAVVLPSGDDGGADGTSTRH